MPTKPRGVRATPARIVELREEMAEREGRMQQQIDELRDRLEDRDTLARELAHVCGVAIATTLSNHRRTTRKGDTHRGNDR